MRQKVCAADGCAALLRSHNAAGFCVSHRGRRTRGAVRKLCSADGCTSPLWASNKSGLCVDHTQGSGKGPRGEYCLFEGCDKKLAAHNLFGFCRAHRHCSEARDAHNKAWQQQHYRKPDVNAERLAYQRFRKTGFSAELFDAVRAFQHSRCAICRCVLEAGVSAKSVAADHCHTANKPRGLLCMRCNTLLGMYELFRADGATYPRFDEYLNFPPVVQFHLIEDERNYHLQYEYEAAE